MYSQIEPREIFGLIKPINDVHFLGISTISNLLKGCGYNVVLATKEEMEAVREIKKINNISLILKWIIENKITRIGFSYRLDPNDAVFFFNSLYSRLEENKMFHHQGGIIKGIFFAGLPDACNQIQNTYSNQVICFPGDESPEESLNKLKIPLHLIPHDSINENGYDKMRLDFASRYIESEKYKNILPPDHSGYPDYGTEKDSIIKRIGYSLTRRTLPLIRVHAGPYNPDRSEALKQFLSWERELANAGYLDILSLGTSQLTQSHFGESWEGLSNGGGIPVNSELEYHQIKEAAKPMLVRTYAGTKNLIELSNIYERSLNMAWHALSFWWFCKIDGRGENSLQENLKEHFETIRHIASSTKPLEPNVPHHFAFRGADDATFVISGYLCAKAAKKLGIKNLILQIMLNTPKHTWGVQDIAKSRTLLKLVRQLESPGFKIHLQTRAGLDYFSPDLEKAKIQLAAVTALMDDIEPDNIDSPEIIHVVSYSEAIHLATPEIINDSIKITLGSLKEYRFMKQNHLIDIHNLDKELDIRTEDLTDECREAIEFLETHFPSLYTPLGFYELFKNGYFPLPFLNDEGEEFAKAKSQTTALKNGGVKVVDQKGNVIRTIDRYRKIFEGLYF